MGGALGVVITTDVPVSGQHAQPVYVDDTLPIVGPSQAIVVTTGEVPQLGGPPLAVRLAPAGTPALGPALPVYVIAGGGSLGGGSAGPPALIYLINDQFTTNQSAPLGSPRAAEPGPGSWTVVDTANKVSIASNRLTFLSTTTSNADPRLSDAVGARAVVPGRVLQMTFNVAATGMPQAGWGTAAGTVPTQGIIIYNGTLYVLDNGLQIGTLSAYTANVDYVATLIQRYGGVLIIIQGSTQFASASLFWVTGTDLSPNVALKALIGTFLGAGPARFDDVTMLDYGGEWSKHYPNASTATLLPAAGATATVAADCIIELFWKGIAAETVDIAVRYVDDSNRWAIRFAQATSTLSIIEVNAGVETVRVGPTATASGNITANDWCRLVIKCSGTRIDFQVKDVSGAPQQLISYSSATFQQTATGFKIIAGTTLYGLAIWSIAQAAPTLSQVSSIAPLNILAIGDSRTGGSADATLVPVTSKNGYLFWLWSTIEAGRGAGAYERPLRIAHSGFTTAQIKAAIDADLAAAVGTPDVVVCNIGVNDLASLPVQATFETNYAYILDAIHTKYPIARIACSKVWGIGEDADSATWATWLDNVLAPRSWAIVGCVESITLKAGDNGAARMADSVHPNTLGHQDLAAAYKTALGL